MPYLITPEQLATIAGKATPLMPGLVEWINTACPSNKVNTPCYSAFQCLILR
jgi:hypothetical protein